MAKKKVITQRGFSVVELMIVAIIASIVILAAGIVLIDGPRRWQSLYNRENSDVVTDSYVARRVFDRVIRNASGENYLLDSAGGWLEVYYYANDDSTDLDRYTRLYQDSNDLMIEYGRLDPKETLSFETICGNVINCTFKANGTSAQMILRLDNGDESVKVLAAAFMHN